MSVVSADGGSAGAVPVDPVRCAELRARNLLDAGDVPAARVVTEDALRAWPDRPELLRLLAELRARDLLDAEDVPAAREVTEDALRAWPDRPELLWLLADVEFADGDQKAAMCCLAEAVDASGGDAAAISRQIGALSENHLWRETLTTVKHIPERVHDDPLVRAAIGDFYRTLNCHGHAVSCGYWGSSGLSSSARKKRRRSWLRSGGPFTFVRHRVDAWEESQLLSDLAKTDVQPLSWMTVPDLDSRQAHRLKVRLENAYYEWSYHYELLGGSLPLAATAAPCSVPTSVAGPLRDRQYSRTSYRVRLVWWEEPQSARLSRSASRSSSCGAYYVMT